MSRPKVEDKIDSKPRTVPKPKKKISEAPDPSFPALKSFELLKDVFDDEVG